MTTATMRGVMLVAGMTLATAAAAAGAPAFPAVDHDHIAYVRPYAKAFLQAQRERRLLIVRPFPVGGVVDGSRDGRWCPLADYMRATTLSDETVTTLLNRRFVFTYFSLVDRADLSDAEAKQAVLRVAPEYGAKTRRTPPTFFFSPAGEVLATLDTLASAGELLDLAKRLLAEHPEYAHPSPEEADVWASAATDPGARLQVARLQLELADAEGAKRTLAALVETDADVPDAVRAEALSLLAARARVEGDVPGATRYLTKAEALPSAAPAGIELDLRMERAHLLALRGDWDGSLRAWSAIEAELPAAARRDELWYWKGLSYYHLGRRREANYTWVRVLKEIPEGRYYQRARLAALGPVYSLPSPDLGSPGKGQRRRWRSRVDDPSRLPGSDLGYGTSSSGRTGTDETPEQFLRQAWRDYDAVERRRRPKRSIVCSRPRN